MTERAIPSSGPGARATPTFGVAAPGYRLPVATRVGAVRLQVADLSRSEEFYSRVLGLAPSEQAEGRASLRAPGAAEPLIELVEHPGARTAGPRGRIGLYHYAILLPDRAALARFAVHANDLGLRMGMSDHLVSEALYFSDPDGLGIEVYADRPRSAWRWDQGQLVMATDPLDVVGLLREAGDEPFAGVPSGTRIGHLHLHVRDLGEAAAFYHEALGFDKVVWSYPGALFLSAGGYHHHVGLNTWAADAPNAGPDDARLLAWTLVLPDGAAVERAAESIVSAGYRVVREPGRILALDPWGTAVALVHEQGLRANGPGSGSENSSHPRSGGTPD